MWQCTPCREGTGWIDKILHNVVTQQGKLSDIQTISDVCDTLNGKTICVFAPAVADIIGSIVVKFKDEFETYILGNQGVADEWDC